MYAEYRKLKRNDEISNGDNHGVIDTAAFGMVLINWTGINPVGTPPIHYPADVWNFKFGSNYTIIKSNMVKEEELQ